MTGNFPGVCNKELPQFVADLSKAR